ncbi:MAG: hypothetical protein FWG24_04580 [Eggerthellaceae bacterium]|nr:hypothetical protein [Eggerthellaceae bacterium]
MSQTDIKCPRCGAGQYNLTDSKTGEVICQFCRNKWIVQELIEKTATEKFLEEAAKQPKIMVDNTTETDKQLMDMIGKIASGGFLNGVRRIGRGIRTIIIVVIVIVVAAFIINSLGGLSVILEKLGSFLG